jgi:hypothetical protein
MAAAPHAMIGDAIAAEWLEYLRDMNRQRGVIGQKPLAV